ncbi:rna-binding protein 47-like protein [Lasius niger]|uniref:Rna-binding protein 47-like protein n=1 Tax=Lasius niger TaxID=67767 RepID=A0A0J7KBP2_LASNI|nr:rna-binding protein 47-like protein [Lasius niger]
MCPALRRQLQTHKNVLRLLHEHKLASTQINGQRILSIQPIRWTGPTPGIDCEIFVGRIPKTIYEDTLYPLFKTIGEVFQIRLMVDMAELTRGYCFIMYTNPEDAGRAIVQLDQFEISPGKKIRVLASVNKCKLYIGPLPWYIASEEVVRVIYASAWDIEYVSIYRFPNHDAAAYAIVSFKSHRNAALARRKLRPEKLFKCNEVHVEWARVDWNPSNVYEDRGTVDDKGDVHIVRKYLQPKKTTATSSLAPAQSESNRCQKQLPPICPPSSPGINGNDRGNLVKSIRNPKNTRYATMLSTLNDKTETLTDINDNDVQLLDVVKDQRTRQTSDIDASTDSFRNFDMWNSNLLSQLSGSSANSGSSKESPNTMCESARDWENDARYSLPKATSSLGRRDAGNRACPNSVSNHRYPCQNHRSFGKTIDQNQLIGDAIQYQVLPYRNPAASCYVLLPQNYLCPKDAIANYPQPSFVNHRIPDELPTNNVPLFANSDRRSSLWYNGNQTGSIAIDKDFIVGEGVAAKQPETDIASGYIQNYSPNILLNFTPIYASENGGTTPYLVSFDAINGNDDKRPRPILKQTTTGRAWL